MSEPRDLARAWQAVLGKLELEIPRPSYITYLEGTRALRLEGGALVVESNRLSCDELNGRMSTIIEHMTYQVFGEEIRVLFVPRGSAEASPTWDGHPARADGAPGASAGPLVGKLDASYTFERYLPAQGNEVARACCMEVLTGDCFSSGPIVLCGRPGMGKTHLLHAMASRAARAGWRVAYLTAEEYTSRFTSAVFRKSVEEFHEVVRSAQLLLVDDLQDFAGREKTQMELANTIDAVRHAGGYVAVASERPPEEIDLIERLASRLEEGMVVRVHPFIGDERRRYVEMLARESSAALPAWAIERIVGVEVPSVRVLHGATQRAIFLARHNMLTPAQLDEQLVMTTVREVAPGLFDDREVLEAVARNYQLCFDDLVSETRKGQATEARAVAAAVLQERGRSLAQIGTVLGRNRSTIQGLTKRGHGLLEANPELRLRVAG